MIEEIVKTVSQRLKEAQTKLRNLIHKNKRPFITESEYEMQEEDWDEQQEGEEQQEEGER